MELILCLFFSFAAHHLLIDVCSVWLTMHTDISIFGICFPQELPCQIPCFFFLNNRISLVVLMLDLSLSLSLVRVNQALVSLSLVVNQALVVINFHSNLSFARSVRCVLDRATWHYFSLSGVFCFFVFPYTSCGYCKCYYIQGF